MKDYSFVIELMQWSFSRIQLYRTCPYAWFCQYILREDRNTNFYSEYGTFVHELLARFYKGEATKDEIVMDYITKFNSNVVSVAKGKTFESIRENSYLAGTDYLQKFIPFEFKKLIGVEEKIEFELEGRKIIGYIDLVGFLEDNEIEIIDHKSAKIKPRSKRKTPTKTDEELDNYLIQLYLYSIWVFEKFGKYPKYLTFNCFKTGEIIREVFDIEKLEEAKDWAIRTIKRVESETQWKPNLDFYFCRNLCNCRDTCEYLETT